ncbi:MAG: hypothetical protein AAF649_01800 [Verrucomicrobiota bacterium]
MSDSADAYREHDFPGKKFIAIGVAAWGLYWLSSWAIVWNEAPKPLLFVTWGILTIASVFYLIGYWHAVKGKGYPGVLWLASLTGIIGVIIIFFLPNKTSNNLVESTP